MKWIMKEPTKAAPKAEAKQNRHRKVPNMQKRLHNDDMSLMQKVAELGMQSDEAVMKNRPADLVMNRAFAEHQQRLMGTVERIAKVRTIPNGDMLLRRISDEQAIVATGSHRIPQRVENMILRSAFKRLDAIEYEPCRKVKGMKCQFSAGHINPCREE